MTREEVIKESQEYATYKSSQKNVDYKDIEESFLTGADFALEVYRNKAHYKNEVKHN